MFVLMYVWVSSEAMKWLGPLTDLSHLWWRAPALETVKLNPPHSCLVRHKGQLCAPNSNTGSLHGFVQPCFSPGGPGPVLRTGAGSSLGSWELGRVITAVVLRYPWQLGAEDVWDPSEEITSVLWLFACPPWVLQLSILDCYGSTLWLNPVSTLNILTWKWIFYFMHLGLNYNSLLCPNADTVSAMLELWHGAGLCGPIMVLNHLDLCIRDSVCIFVHVFLGETALCHPCSHLKFLKSAFNPWKQKHLVLYIRPIRFLFLLF